MHAGSVQGPLQEDSYPRSFLAHGRINLPTKRSGVLSWLWYRKLDTAMVHGSRTKWMTRGSALAGAPQWVAASGQAKSGDDVYTSIGRGDMSESCRVGWRRWRSS